MNKRFARVSIQSSRGRTVPKNHECAIPARVKPNLKTLKPVVKTAVFAIDAEIKPGEGLDTNTSMVCKASLGLMAAVTMDLRALNRVRCACAKFE